MKGSKAKKGRSDQGNRNSILPPSSSTIASVASSYPSASSNVNKIEWPPLPTPSQRRAGLSIEEVLTSQILLIHHFFPPKACASWLSFLSNSKNIPLAATPPAGRGEAQRTNHRFSVKDEALAKALWEDTGLRDLVQSQEHAKTFESSERRSARPAGLNPNIRVSEFAVSLTLPLPLLSPVTCLLV